MRVQPLAVIQRFFLHCALKAYFLFEYAFSVRLVLLWGRGKLCFPPPFLVWGPIVWLPSSLPVLWRWQLRSQLPSRWAWVCVCFAWLLGSAFFF